MFWACLLPSSLPLFPLFPPLLNPNPLPPRHIFPTISQTIFAAGTKGDVRVAAAEALKALQHCCPMGESVWAWETDTSKQEELRRMVGGKN